MFPDIRSSLCSLLVADFGRASDATHAWNYIFSFCLRNWQQHLSPSPPPLWMCDRGSGSKHAGLRS